jgi:hypothetical protein
MMERVTAADDIKRSSCEGQRIDVAPMPRHVTQAFPRRELSRLLEHRFGGVEPFRPAHPPRKGRHDAAWSAGNVERDIIGSRARGLEQQIQRGFVVMRCRRREPRSLTGELVRDDRVVRRSNTVGDGHYGIRR